MLWSEKLHYLWPPCVADADTIFMADIFALWFLSFFLLLSIFPHLISVVTDWMSTILLHRVWRWKCRTHKIAKNSPSGHHRANLSGYIFAIKAHIDNRKKIVKQQCLPKCDHNMVNFGALAAEICWQDWGNPENFNGFRVLAALLHGTLVVGVTRQPNFAALNRGRHVYSAGWPSRWALAHIFSHGRPME